MNKAILIGRMTKDAEVRYTQQKNTAVAKLTLAVDRKTEKDKTDFINCVAWGKVAELIEKYVRKGDRLGIVGHIQTGSYEKDGKKVYTTEVFVEELEFLTSKSEKKSEKQEGEKQEQSYEGFSQLTDEDIPF